MKQITTIGLDLAKQVFQVHGADAQAVRSSTESYVEPKCCAFSRSCLRVWSAWRPAAVRIIGRARSRRSVTTSA
jgi:hypothetical protein